MTHFRLFPAALLAFGTLAATSACATGYTYGRPPERSVYYANADRLAYDNGFHDGIREGEHDAKSGRRYEPSHHGEWRDADDGYHRNYGDRDYYRRNFRSGFEAGYSQGFRHFDDGHYRR
ncbi:MAG TPA: hypothetical protein VH583_06110 [Vicinamibacterales bacterium]|jgi:hypothetical protein